jgi:hypothetical protein
MIARYKAPLHHQLEISRYDALLYSSTSVFISDSH